MSELKYIECKEIAKEVRKELKDKYPDIKFSVKTTHNSLDIRYIDGVVKQEIEAIANKYTGRSDWDSNYADYRKNNPIEFKGEKVYSLIVWLNVHRDFSPKFLTEVLVFVKSEYADHQDDGVFVTDNNGVGFLDSKNDWETLKNYREVAERCDNLSPIIEQERIRSEKEENSFEFQVKEFIEKISLVKDSREILESGALKENSKEELEQIEAVKDELIAVKEAENKYLELAKPLKTINNKEIGDLIKTGGITIKIITDEPRIEPVDLSFLISHFYATFGIEVIDSYTEVEAVDLNHLFSKGSQKTEAEILKIRRTSFENSRNCKIENYKRLEEKHHNLSNSSHQISNNIANAIPFGQPILVDHHSESHHRRDLKKIDNNIKKSIEHEKTANYYAKKLATIENNEVISSSDPDAIAKLESKLEAMQSCQDIWKQINKIVRKKVDDEQKIQELINLGIEEISAKEFLKPDFCGRLGVPDYRLQNNNGNMRRVKERITELKQKLDTAIVESESEVECPELGLKIVHDRIFDRIRLVFNSKPFQEVREILKSHGFRWSPSQSAWQRQLNENGEFALSQVLEKLKQM